jgi:hypothetical protein
MDLPLCVASTILFSAAFQTLNDTASLVLSNNGYSNVQISFVILARTIGKICTGFFLKNIVKKVGIFKSVVGAMIVFCEAVCIFWFMNSIQYITVLSFLTSIIFNFIFLSMNSAIRSYGNAKLLVTYYSISQILSSLFLTFPEVEKIILILSAGLLSLGCFLFRDLKKSQLDTNEKGEGSIIKVYFKYGRYFWPSLLYSLSHWLISKYLLLSLISLSLDKNRITNILIFLPLGRLCLNYFISKMIQNLSPSLKIIFSSVWTIITSILFAYTLNLKNWIFLLSVFCSGVFLNSKVFIMEYFSKNRLPEDYNISLQLTEQQIDSVSQFLVIILGSILSSFSPARGILSAIIALHILVIICLII